MVKKILVSSVVLVHYNPDLPICLAGLASAYGVGALILMCSPMDWSISWVLPHDPHKELSFDVKHFHSYLYGRHFTIVTDHKPLTAILGPKKGIPC